MGRLPLAWLIAACLCFASAAARADIVKMKDGRNLEGKVTQEDDNELKLELSRGGAITIKKADIVEIVRQKSTMEVLDEKLRALRPRDPAAYLETGKWCLQEIKREDIGLRLISTAMVLDPKLYSQGQIALGDYFLGQKRDKARAADCFLHAVMAEPANPACLDRFRQIKAGGQEILKAADRSLGEALADLHKNDWAAAVDDLPSALHSAARRRVEELLGQKLDAVLAYCQSKIPCKVCKGVGTIPCSDCKGQGWRECKTCGGGGTLNRMSAKGSSKVRCTDCDGSGKLLCKRCKAYRTGGGTTSTGTTFGTVIGGKVACPVCKGKAGTTNNAPPPYPASGVDQATQYLEHRLSGVLTLAEQGETRMVRVGGAPPIEGAEELAANPVWTGDRWGPADEPVETPTKTPEPAADQELAVLASFRDGATRMQTDKAGAEKYIAQVRQSFGTDAVSGDSARRVYCTDFALLGAPADEESSGPCVEVDLVEVMARPVLAQVGKTFSTSRITLVTAGAEGVVLPHTADWVRQVSAAGSVLRLYYNVVEGKEDVIPGNGRDVGIYQLTIKLLLVDLVDAGGKVIRSAR